MKSTISHYKLCDFPLRTLPFLSSANPAFSVRTLWFLSTDPLWKPPNFQVRTLRSGSKYTLPRLTGISQSLRRLPRTPRTPPIQKHPRTPGTTSEITPATGPGVPPHPRINRRARGAKIAEPTVGGGVQRASARPEPISLSLAPI